MFHLQVGEIDNNPKGRGAYFPIGRLSGQLNFVYLCAEYGACFLSPFWRLEF